jgi:hypothetical protein
MQNAAIAKGCDAEINKSKAGTLGLLTTQEKLKR